MVLDVERHGAAGPLHPHSRFAAATSVECAAERTNERVLGEVRAPKLLRGCGICVWYERSLEAVEGAVVEGGGRVRFDDQAPRVAR